MACGSSSTGSSGSTGGGSGSTAGGVGSGPIDELVTPSSVSVEAPDVIDLGFGTLSAARVTLPSGHVNAREVYQLSHYTARTDSEVDENDIDIAMRNYVAACETDSGTPHLFVSQTLAESDADGAPTFGSVYELRWDADAGRFVDAGNATLLPSCYESHGVAVSPDCSRVGVLCNTPYQASDRYDDLTADLSAAHGHDWMNWEDNEEEVDAQTNDREERERRYRYNDQIWLLEWDGIALSERPTSHVVTKNHGGTHTGAQALIYVDDDSQGRASYGFAVTARVYDPGGGTHYSSMLGVVDRNDWSMDLSRSGRGWYWACGHGHNTHIRPFYNPEVEQYGAFCTSDGNDWFGGRHGPMGTIAIKMEDTSSTYNGWSQHFVPSHSSLTTNGGGHTTVPVEGGMLTLIVAPDLIGDEARNQFLADEVGVDPTSGGPFGEQCYGEFDTNCYYGYLDYGDPYDVEVQDIFGGGTLSPRALTRIGLKRVDPEGRSFGVDYTWIAEDDDCQLGDPQLVDLHNGRFLLGYARFQCISDGLPYNRVFSSRGADRMLIPKHYVIAEIDDEGNLLAGPYQLDDHGWGGIDEPVSIGPGRVAWTYLPDPTFEGYGGGQRSEWEVLVYESATPAP